MQMEPRCLCGQAMTFPKRKNVSHCKTAGCGVRWERDQSGYWAFGFRSMIFTPIFLKVIACSVQSRDSKYPNHTKSRRKKRRARA